MSNRRIRILTFSTLFPNPVQKRHGIFVETRLKHLRDDYPVDADVVAPVPWFPFSSDRFGDYSRYARVPAEQRRDGVNVQHPRYLVIPKLSWRFAPYLLYCGARVIARKMHALHRYELIDAHYFYPDGVAAVMLGKALGIPVMITARGSDITVMPRYFGPRQLIRWAADNSEAVVTVCSALRDELVSLGVEKRHVTVLRNGVDLMKFTPGDRGAVRKLLSIGNRRMLLSVGNLIELKGNHITLAALASMSDAVLVLIGDGPEKEKLENLSRQLGVADRVIFVGTVEQHLLPAYYRAADALILASRSEGWANVLLEAMACGCPVVASSVWGTPEVVQEASAGVLAEERTPEAFVMAVARLFENYPDRETTRAYAERFDWRDTSRGQYELMCRITSGNWRQVGS